MWAIEISEEAPEEEINQAILEEVDFDYIRECIARLKGLVEKYGPFTEVEEQREDSDPTVFTKTFHDKRGWICDELASLDPLKVWTVNWDPVNGYSYLSSGYEFEESKQGIVEIKTWFIADKNFDQVEEKNFKIDTEFIISHIDTNSQPGDMPYYVLNIWDILDAKDLSDEEIALEITSELYYF